MKILLDANQSNVHQWSICGDLKVTCVLMGMQGGFTQEGLSRNSRTEELAKYTTPNKRV
jgi:hypothetical protein